MTERSFTDSENKDCYNEYIHKANTKGGLTEHTVQADYTIPLNKHTLSIGAKIFIEGARPVHYIMSGIPKQGHG